MEDSGACARMLRRSRHIGQKRGATSLTSGARAVQTCAHRRTPLPGPTPRQTRLRNPRSRAEQTVPAPSPTPHTSAKPGTRRHARPTKTCSKARLGGRPLQRDHPPRPAAEAAFDGRPRAARPTIRRVPPPATRDRPGAQPASHPASTTAFLWVHPSVARCLRSGHREAPRPAAHRRLRPRSSNRGPTRTS